MKARKKHRKWPVLSNLVRGIAFAAAVVVVLLVMLNLFDRIPKRPGGANAAIMKLQ